MDRQIFIMLIILTIAGVVAGADPAAKALRKANATAKVQAKTADATSQPATSPAGQPTTQSATVATRLTLKLVDASIADTIAAMQKQVPFKIVYRPTTPKQDVPKPDSDEPVVPIAPVAPAAPVAEAKITLDVTDMPFWEVIARLGSQSPVQINTSDPAGGRLMLGTGGTNFFTPRAVTVGPVMIVPTGVSSTVKMQYGDDEADLPDAPGDPADKNVQARRAAKARKKEDDKANRISLQMMVLIEPHFWATSMHATVTQATDEQGHSLMGLASGGGNPSNRKNPQSTQVNAVMDMPPGVTSRRIVMLKGLLQYKVPGRVDRVEVPDIASRVNQRVTIDGVHYTIGPLVPTEKGVIIKVPLEVQKGDVNPSNDKIQQIFNLLQCTDAAGNPLGHAPLELRATDQKTLEFVLTFGPGKNAGPPAVLFWEFPRDWIDVELPFEMRDIPLIP